MAEGWAAAAEAGAVAEGAATAAAAEGGGAEGEAAVWAEELEVEVAAADLMAGTQSPSAAMPCWALPLPLALVLVTDGALFCCCSGLLSPLEVCGVGPTSSAEGL